MSILVFCLIEDLGWGCGWPGGREGYRRGIGDCGRKCSPFIVWGCGSSCGSPTFLLVGALRGPVSGGATVQAKVVFPAAFLFNRGDRSPLLAAILVLAGSGG